MKTKGIEIVEGFLLVEPGHAVPPPFWDRLRHEITKRGLMEEHRADFARERDAVRVERKAGGFTSERSVAEADREERLFRRWVERLGLASEPWPWQRGWTEDLVDSYLQPEAARRAA
jgi:hypothetical protein